MLTHDALNVYVTDRRQAREQAATVARTGRLLRRARLSFGAGRTTAPPIPVPAPLASSPAPAHATGAAAGTAGVPAVVDLRTTTTAGPRPDRNAA